MRLPRAPLKPIAIQLRRSNGESLWVYNAEARQCAHCAGGNSAPRRRRYDLFCLPCLRFPSLSFLALSHAYPLARARAHAPSGAVTASFSGHQLPHEASPV